MNGQLLLLVVVIAITHAFTVDETNVQSKLNQLNPTFMMLEQLLNLEDKDECIEKMFCFMETEISVHKNNPLCYYSMFLTNASEEIDPVSFEKVKDLINEYPLISRVVEAIMVGRNGTTSDSCSQKYTECSTDKNELLDFVMMVEDGTINTHLRNKQTRVKRSWWCDYGGLGCSLIGGGCAICALMSASTCFAICGPAAGLACAAFGVGCFFG